MLSDEEKEAIEWLKRLVELNKRDNLDDTFAEILLNLIEKQSKEIEELKKHKITFTNDYKPIGSNGRRFISEDKIKAKIEEINNEYINKILSNEKMSLDLVNINTHRYNAMKLVLEELLEND